jgi:hypothetical protein
MAAWIWFGIVGVLTNLAAIALLWTALRTREVESLQRLQRRAVVCAVVATCSSGLGILLGVVQASGAVGGVSVDPSQRARVLAEGISEAMNGAALGLVTGPLPVAALIAIVLRTRRQRALGAPPT